MKKEIKLFYDLTAKETADQWYKEQILMPTIQEFISLLPNNPKVLDMGCGPGYESMRLASIGAEVTGIDFSDECIRIAKERCCSCQFEVMDFFELDDRFGKFDGIVAYASLIHVKPKDFSYVLRKVNEVLKEEGYFETIVQDGVGTSKNWPIVKGRKMKRIIYRYNRVNLISYCSESGLAFVGEGFMDYNLMEKGWRCYIFQKKKNPDKVNSDLKKK